MGDFTLGCLLGQYDRAQSFDVASAAVGMPQVGSWFFKTSASLEHSFNADPANVHSSGQGLVITTYSYGSPHDAVLRYRYNTGNDAYARWFPDVTTHDLQTLFFARLLTGGTNGLFEASLDNKGYLGVIYSPELQRYQIKTTTFSGETTESPFLDFDVVSGHTGSVAFIIDDVLTQIDPIVLHPEYSFREQARVIQSQHRTSRGNLYTYRWGRHFSYTVPLRFLPDSHAALINWWWENQFNLAFTLDTSDAQSVSIVRITNDRQPIDGRIAPYKDLWQGTLQLESINDGALVF